MRVLLIFVIIFGFLSLAAVGAGTFLLIKKPRFDTSAEASVSNVSCADDKKCTATLTYKDTGGDSVSRTAILNGPVADGSTRNIVYNSSNPMDMYPAQPPVRILAISLIAGGGLIALLCVIAGIYMFRHSAAPAPAPAPTPDAIDQDEYTEREPEPVPEPQYIEERPMMQKSTTVPTPPSDEVVARQYADDMVYKATEPARMEQPPRQPQSGGKRPSSRQNKRTRASRARGRR